MTAVSDAPAAARPRTPVAVALGWMGLALASFSAVAIAGREAGRGMTTFELMAWRSWICLAVLLVILAASGSVVGAFRSRRLPLHGTRAIVHFGAQFCWLKALTLIPLAQLFALEFTSPVWVALLAPLLLGERFTGWRMLAGAIGFAGVLVTLGGGSASLDTGTVLALASALGFALSMISTKMLTRTESTATILLYMFVLQSIIALPIVGMSMRVPELVPLLWASAVAVTSMSAHFALTKAFAAADAMVVAPMDFLRLPLIAVVAAVLYQEAVDPKVLAGGAVIVVANLINIWAESRRRRT